MDRDLRLAICKEIVESHNGTISVKRAPGQGTEFTTTLPKNPKSPIEIS